MKYHVELTPVTINNRLRITRVVIVSKVQEEESVKSHPSKRK